MNFFNQRQINNYGQIGCKCFEMGLRASTDQYPSITLYYLHIPCILHSYHVCNIISRTKISYIFFFINFILKIIKPYNPQPFDHGLVSLYMAHFYVMEDLRSGGERISVGRKGKDINVISHKSHLNLFFINNFWSFHKYFVKLMKNSTSLKIIL